jgi:hypothetical protein
MVRMDFLGASNVDAQHRLPQVTNKPMRPQQCAQQYFLFQKYQN